MKQLTDEQKAKMGQHWAEILMLKRSKEHKDRYLTTYGDKTALGVYETLNSLVYGRYDDIPAEIRKSAIAVS